MTIIIVALIVIGLVVLLLKSQENEIPNIKNKEIDLSPLVNEKLEQELAEVYQEIERLEYIKSAYNPKWMFTQNEKRAYYKLREIANKHGMVVFAKVRLFDLVEPRKGHQKYKTNLYRIQAKHVDFVLTKSNLVATHVIEMDDGSHDTPDRKERDKFVDTVLTSCGYKVLHTREIQEAEIEKFLS